MWDIARVVGLIVAGLVLVVVAAAVGTFVVSEHRLNQTRTPPADAIAVPTDISAIQRGQHLASAVAICTECHGANLAGRVVIDDRAIGRLVAPNLTRGRGGVGGTFSNADFVRAIRDGVDPKGRLLLIMPSDNYNSFNDSDLGAIIAYVRSVTAIDSALPGSEIRPFGRILFVLGQLSLQPSASIDAAAPRPASPLPGVSAEYGAYLALTGGCVSCHGPGLGGGKIPGTSFVAANITPAGLGRWGEVDFIRAMRNGIRPDGRRLDTYMPWPYYAQLTDDELRALWRYLQAVPARQTGTR